MAFNEDFLNEILSSEGEIGGKVTKIISEYNADINGLKSKNQELLGKVKTYQTNLEELTGKNTDYETQIENLTGQLKEKLDDKSKEEFYNNELAKKQKSFDEALATITAERDEYKKYKIESLRDKEIELGTKDLRFVDNTLRKAFIYSILSEHTFEPKEIDGEMKFLDKENRQLSDVIKDFALSNEGKSFIANGNSGGDDGIRTVTKSSSSVVNPFKKETRNVSAQMKIFKENPALARQLANEAGVKL